MNELINELKIVIIFTQKQYIKLNCSNLKKYEIVKKVLKKL